MATDNEGNAGSDKADEGDGGKGGDGSTESEFKAPTSQAELDQIVARRLARERSKYADYNDLKAKAQKYEQVEQSAKSETEKLNDRLSAAEKRAEEAERNARRLEVATAKGLTAAQAKRLVGSTVEELEADANELLESFGGKRDDAGEGSAPRTRPTERLRFGGGAPDEPPEETDPAKLAEKVPRGGF